MKSHAFVSAIFFGLVFSYSHAQNEHILSSDFKDRMDSILKEKNVPTVAIGLIENNEIVMTEVIGISKPINNASSDLQFSVASLTKPVSMMLALTLASNKTWNLDEPLAHYWIDPDVRGDTLAYQLTSRHVLSHQGGFTNWRSMNPDGKLVFDTGPGVAFRYSGEGYEYLRRAIENKFDQHFEYLVDSLVFKPLHLNHSFMKWPDQLDTLHYAGRFDLNGKKYPIEKAASANAAASLITTIRDYTRFALACLRGEGISTDLNKQIHTPQIMVTQVKDVGIGLSWVVLKNLTRNEYALMHTGSDPGIKTLIVLLPTSKRGLVVFTNGDNGNKVYEEVLREMLDVGNEILLRMKKNS
ncbi:serine hydrolase domain-containing protein [Flavitalea sp.]|nr:serine hydrolase domain-containing protein [Flavitalea sp.]